MRKPGVVIANPTDVNASAATATIGAIANALWFIYSQSGNILYYI